MKKYETIIIFGPDSSREEMEKVLERVRGTITEKGEILDVVEWGKKRFAYPINKRHEGFYYFITFNGSIEIPKEIARISRVTESVYRSRTFLRDDTVTAAPQRKVRPKPVESSQPIENVEKAEVVAETVTEVVAEKVVEPNEAIEAEVVVTEETTEKVVEEVTTETGVTSEQQDTKDETASNQEEENVK
ncbi:MAG: 30S ribosomal protein S6 [Caldisericia bacterium]|nr:30S ribosomal protein S6 [Caldisericia bacterium]